MTRSRPRGPTSPLHASCGVSGVHAPLRPSPGANMRAVWLVALSASVAMGQQGYGGGAYEAELRRRQLEYQQQQAAQLRYQQAQAAQAQTSRQQQQQQLMMEAMQRSQREQRMAQQGYAQGAGMGGAGGRPPMSNKEKALLKKRQEAQAKAQKAAAAKRSKAFKQAQRAAQKRGGAVARANRGSSHGDGPVAFLMSPKGLALVGGVTALWFFQRPLVLSLLKYPLLIAKVLLQKVWNLLMKPLLRKFLVARSRGGGAAAVGGELPGGSY